MSASFIRRLIQAPSRLLPSSSLTHCTHPSLFCRYHACDTSRTSAPSSCNRPLPPSQWHLTLSFSTHIFADPTLTYSACTPANGLHRMCSNLVLPPTFHPGNALSARILKLNFTKMAMQFAIIYTVYVSQNPSLALILCLTITAVVSYSATPKSPSMDSPSLVIPLGPIWALVRLHELH